VHTENETSDVQPKCQGPLQLLSPPFLMTSTTKQMRSNGRGPNNMQLDIKENVIYCVTSSIRAALCTFIRPLC